MHILLSVMLLLVTAAATGASHNHGGAQATAAPCSGPGALPSLTCAHAPSATFDTNGRLWLTWAYTGHIYVQHSDDLGKTFSPPVAVNRVPEQISAHGEDRPKIALANAGRVYITWTQRLPRRYTGHVRFSRSMDSGISFSEPITVNDNRARISHRFAALKVNAQGDIFLAWLDKRDRQQTIKAGGQYRGAALYSTWSDDAGRTFHPNRKVLDHSCECCRVAMAIDRDQLPVILWRHIYGKNTRDHALVKFRRADRPGTPVRVSHDNWRIDACPHHGPALDISHDGTYHLTWFNNAEQRHGLFYAYSVDQGKTFSTPIAFGDYESAAGHADILSHGARVYLVWREFDGEHNRIHAMQSEDGGQHWSEPRKIAATTGEADYPFLVATGETVYLSWHAGAGGYRLLPLSEVQP